jgi:hypothetical protein
MYGHTTLGHTGLLLRLMGFETMSGQITRRLLNSVELEKEGGGKRGVQGGWR